MQFSVSDTGIGIAREHIGLVFDSFYQAGQTVTRIRGGSGLGLTIAKNLVDLMGGQISVESEVDVGSRFIFTVPLRTAAVLNRNERAARRLIRPFRALLVESSAAQRRVMMSYLTSWRIDAVACETASVADAAWRGAIAAGKAFDAVVVDVKGLGSAGIELIRAMTTPDSKSQVIALLGIDNLMSDATLAQLNLYATLTKPARPSELFNCLVAIAAGDRSGELLPFLGRRTGQGQLSHFNANVLLVEDNPVNQDVAVGMLEALGCRTVTAADGRSAIEWFEKERFDLILMDCEMPIMDGFAAASRIREIETARTMQRTNIIAVTAHALPAVHDKCLAAGMDDFLVKPFTDFQLVAALRRWIPACERKATETTDRTAPRGTIDLTTIDHLRTLERHGNESLISRVVTQFAQTAPPLLETIRTKRDEGDCDAIWRAAHSLKSSAAAVGARQLSARCSEIERIAREDRVLPGGHLIVELEAELTAATARLNELI